MQILLYSFYTDRLTYQMTNWLNNLPAILLNDWISVFYVTIQAVCRTLFRWLSVFFKFGKYDRIPLYWSNYQKYHSTGLSSTFSSIAGGGRIGWVTLTDGSLMIYYRSQQKARKKRPKGGKSLRKIKSNNLREEDLCFEPWFKLQANVQPVTHLITSLK